MQVFLSYSESDREYAGLLSSELSKRGYKVWDSRDELFPGDNWALKIGEALQKSKAMVVLISPDSMKSEWVRSEIQYAIGDQSYEKRMFPVVVKRTSGIPWILRKLNLIDPNTPGRVAELIAGVLRGKKPMMASRLQEA